MHDLSDIEACHEGLPGAVRCLPYALAETGKRFFGAGGPAGSAHGSQPVLRA